MTLFFCPYLVYHFSVCACVCCVLCFSCTAKRNPSLQVLTVPDIICLSRHQSWPCHSVLETEGDLCYSATLKSKTCHRIRSKKGHSLSTEYEVCWPTFVSCNTRHSSNFSSWWCSSSSSLLRHTGLPMSSEIHCSGRVTEEVTIELHKQSAPFKSFFSLMDFSPEPGSSVRMKELKFFYYSKITLKPYKSSTGVLLFDLRNHLKPVTNKMLSSEWPLWVLS